jgi:hypothetical protein
MEKMTMANEQAAPASDAPAVIAQTSAADAAPSLAPVSTDPKPAMEAPSLLSAATVDQEKPKEATPADAAAVEAAAAESKARVETFTKTEGKDARLAAYNALSDAEKADAFKGMSDEQRKELGVEDPAGITYTEFKMPEGVTLDAEAIKPAVDLFKEAGLSQDQAQKFIDLAVSREQAIGKSGLKAFTDLQTKWRSDVQADPEIGGGKLTASMAAAARAIDRLGGQPLKDALNLTGAGNNPAVVKAFVLFGRAFSEDRFVPGKDAAPAPRSAAETIYDGAPKGSVDNQ